MAEHPLKHIFNIIFTCPDCKEVQKISGNLCYFLSTMQEGGWPICPECGCDTDYEIVE